MNQAALELDFDDDGYPVNLDTLSISGDGCGRISTSTKRSRSMHFAWR